MSVMASKYSFNVVLISSGVIVDEYVVKLLMSLNMMVTSFRFGIVVSMSGVSTSCRTTDGGKYCSNFERSFCFSLSSVTYQ